MHVHGCKGSALVIWMPMPDRVRVGAQEFHMPMVKCTPAHGPLPDLLIGAIAAWIMLA